MGITKVPIITELIKIIYCGQCIAVTVVILVLYIKLYNSHSVFDLASSHHRAIHWHTVTYHRFTSGYTVHLYSYIVHITAPP